MRGRKPVPARLRELHGSPSHGGAKPKVSVRIDTSHQPAAEEAGLPAPDFFTPSQQEIWSYAVAHAPRGVLTKIDTGVLAVFVIAADLHRQAVMAQNRRQLLIRAPSGMPMVSPYVHIANRQAILMLRAAEQLGFTPTSRARLTTASDDGPDRGDDYASWEAEAAKLH
jgi:P27 family predicted phage terminase small subunit